MTSKKQHESSATRIATPTPTSSDDSRLDEALEESFPASDPIAVDTTEPHHAPANATSSEPKKRREN